MSRALGRQRGLFGVLVATLLGARPASADAAGANAEPAPAVQGTGAGDGRASTKEEAEVEALLASEAEVDETRDRALQAYGFFDFGLQKLFIPRSSFLYSTIGTNATTFMFGNLNLFFDAQPRDEWRTLVELRFTNLPHGEVESFATPAGGQFERVNRAGRDSTSPNGRNRVLFGSVIIERAQAQWTASDAFGIVGGYWFTPYGIWNLDHGTPTLISLLLPDSQVREYFPLRQLGLQALGVYNAPPYQVGYHVTVSNGRTFGQMDLDEDKAVGARAFFASRAGASELKLGASGYYGTFGEKEGVVTSFVPYETRLEQTVAATEWGVGADVSFDRRGLRLRSEGTVHRVEFERGKRAPLDFGRPDARQPDRYDLDAYILVAYRFPESVLEPFLYFEAFHGPSSVGDTTLVPSAGLNVHLAPEVQLKTQAAHIVLRNLVTEGSATGGRNDFTILTSRLVVSF